MRSVPEPATRYHGAMFVPTPAGFNFRATLYSHGWLELAPFGHDEGLTTLERLHRLGEGRVVHLAIRDAGERGLEVEHGGGRLKKAERAEIEAAVRHIFHLELELTEFYELLRGEERYAWVLEHGAGRLLRSPTVWEDLAKTLLTTNTTWAMTRGMAGRLCALGEKDAEGRPTFPTPEQVAALSLDELSSALRAGYRNAYLHELAERIAGGELEVESWAEGGLSSDELFKAIRALKGFGPYAAGAMTKLLGGYGELALDSATRGMFAKEWGDGGEVKDAQIEAHYAKYGEWKGLVIWMDLMRDYFLAALKKDKK